jgi:hypothetical protein
MYELYFKTWTANPNIKPFDYPTKKNILDGSGILRFGNHIHTVIGI